MPVFEEPRDQWHQPLHGALGVPLLRGQLSHLLAVMPLASVSLGIIPFTAQRTVWPLEAFYIHDDPWPWVETLTAEIKVRQPGEPTDYAKAFARLAQMAVYGDAALGALIQTVDRRPGVNRRNSPQLR